MERIRVEEVYPTDECPEPLTWDDDPHDTPIQGMVTVNIGNVMEGHLLDGDTPITPDDLTVIDRLVKLYSRAIITWEEVIGKMVDHFHVTPSKAQRLLDSRHGRTEAA
jgi:hypothetical protein